MEMNMWVDKWIKFLLWILMISRSLLHWISTALMTLHCGYNVPALLKRLASRQKTWVTVVLQVISVEQVSSWVGRKSSQGLIQSVKSGPVSDVTTPATHHQLEQRGWTEWWSGEKDLSPLVSEEFAGVLDDLFIRQQAVGLLLTQSEDLPQSYSKCPHITSCCELPQ